MSNAITGKLEFGKPMELIDGNKLHEYLGTIVFTEGHALIKIDECIHPVSIGDIKNIDVISVLDPKAIGWIK